MALEAVKRESWIIKDLEMSDKAGVSEKLTRTLAKLNDDAAIELLASGVMLKEIAAKCGVSKQAVHQRLRKHPRYRQAIKDQATALVNLAMEETQKVCLPATETDRAAVDLIDIARVRELRTSAFRYAESANPEEWGQKQQLDVGVSIQVVIADRFNEAGIEVGIEPDIPVISDT